MKITAEFEKSYVITVKISELKKVRFFLNWLTMPGMIFRLELNFEKVNCRLKQMDKIP